MWDLERFLHSEAEPQAAAASAPRASENPTHCVYGRSYIRNWWGSGLTSLFKISNVMARRLQFSQAMYCVKYLKASP